MREQSRKRRRGRIKYWIHPGDYAIGENEAFYAAQAAKGWHLEKRGAYLSRFRKGEPRDMVYRIEYSTPAFLEEQELPAAQVELYEGCGWELAAHHGLMHVFRAPSDRRAPEFYSTPEQQAAALKGLRRSYWTGWLALLLAIGVWLLLAAFVPGRGGTGAGGWRMELRLDLVRATALVLCYGCFLLKGLYQMAYATVRTVLVCRSLRRGEPLDHTPRNKRWGHRIVSGLLLGLCILFVLLTLVQLLGTRQRDLPAVADGPYLLCSDLGIDGTRTDAPFFGDPCEVEVTRSLLANQWNTREFIAAGDAWAALYQDVYEFRTPTQARAFAPVLIATSALFPASSFTAVEVEGLDAAYRAGNEYIAVKGTRAYSITMIAAGLEEPDVFAALAGT